MFGDTVTCMSYKHPRVNKTPQAGARQLSTRGSSMVEVVVAAGICMTAVAGSLSTMASLYRHGTQNQNQILAADMAQEVIDNVRDSNYSKLKSFLNGGTTASQSLPLYTFPADPSISMFPRPLLRNTDSTSGMSYQSATLTSGFNGTVAETITDLAPGNTTNDLLDVKVNVQWQDSTGQHTYLVDTQVSQTGIHT